MDSVTTHTMGIIRKTLSIIPGDSHKFYAQLEANDEHYEKQKAASDRKRKELEEYIARNKVRASTASLAQSKMKQLEKMDTMDSLEHDASLSFSFNYRETPAKIVMEVEGVSFGYEEDHLLFNNITFALKRGETLGIIGKNGKGKSTLLNTLAGELTQKSGTINFHPSTISGHFGQTNIDHLNPNNTVMDEIYVGNPKLPEATVRQICGNMMFSADNAKKKISLLSGGEKSRVMLGKILAKDVNLLFLDEPTNHLDMQSIDALTSAIQNFEGACVIVTHNEALLRKLCTRLIIFARGSAQYFDGGYDDFLEKIGWEEEENEVKEKPAPKSNHHELKKQRAALVQERSKETSSLKKEVETLEKSIISLEEKIERQHEELLLVTNKGDTEKIIDLSTAIAKNEAQVEEEFERLEEAQTKLDDILTQYEEKLSALDA